MKKIPIILLLIPWSFLANAQFQTNPNKKSAAYYSNPIFAGDYPDPSILRDGADYYIVHSSFEYYPGLLIWHSKDLINWKPLTNALHKYVGSVWAPDLVKHKGKFYIYFPANGSNFVVTADAIQGPWSEPIDLKIGGIDPGHITDAEGKRYLYFSNGSYVQLSENGTSVFGDVKKTYSGWSITREWTIECFCLEGPKLMKRGDYYYLTVAQGGTAGPATSHMVISARSKSPFGPWENSPFNPIIRTAEASEKWWSKGHGTVFEDVKGKWWMVYHGYENGFYNMGRQTLLQPIEWTKDGWFKVVDGMKAEDLIKRPEGLESKTAFSLDDKFEGNSLKPHWKFYKDFDPNRFQLADNSLVINSKGTTVSNCFPLLCITPDHSFTAQVELLIEGESTGGLVLFYNEMAHSGILAGNKNIMADIQERQLPTEKGVFKDHVFVRLKCVNSSTVDMYYSLDGEKWIKTTNSLEVSTYNHNAFGGFLSLRVGLCSIGKGKVTFKNFIYKPISNL